MADRKELTIYTLHRSHTYVLDRQFNGRRKELTIYTLHRSHTYVLDRQFNGRQERVNYLHTTQKSYIRAGQTIQWPTEKS